MKLSVIVPIYNVAPYLCKCVDSLLLQDIQDYEIILVNDGSTDNCGEIAQQYADKYANVKLISQENKGLSVARNVGIKQANGKYILFVDSDDYLQPNCLGGLIAQAEKNELDVLRFRYRNVKETGEVIEPNKDSTNYNDYSNISTDGITFLNERMGNQCYAVQFLVRTEIAKLELFTPNIFLEDVDWTPRILLRAVKVSSMNLVIYNYTAREESITSTQNLEKIKKKLEDKFFIIKKLLIYSQSINDTRWINGMIGAMIVSMVGTIATNFYKDRKEHISRIKELNVLPISSYHIVPRAQKKVKLINWSIDLATMLLHITRKR